MRYDVVVIGAGPAGSSTAYHLAAHGYHVLLLDKQPFPREKPCGDGLTPRALLALKHMGLMRLWNDCKRIEAIRIVEHRHSLERELAFEPLIGGPLFGGVLRRYDLDQSVCEAAVAAGAQLWTGVTAQRVTLDPRGLPEVACVTRSTEPFHISSRFVVIAEGSAGSLAKPCGRSGRDRQSVGFAVRQYFVGRSDVGSFFEVHLPLTIADRAIPGYGWLFPVSDDVVNVGVGIAYGRGNPLDRVSLRSAYSELLDRLAESGRVSSMQPCSRLVGAPLRTGLIPEETIAQGILLAGDAAGLVSPFSGEGIAHALESGEIAADAIHDALVNGHREARTYPSRLNSRFRRHSKLRADLPGLYGLARLYDWRPRGGFSQPDCTVLACFRGLLLDSDRPREASLRTLLWKDVLGDSSLLTATEIVEDRVIKELGCISRFFGELAYYTREGALLLPGYSAAVILSAAACAERLDEEALHIAVASELLVLAVLFHTEVGGASETRPEGWRPIDAAAILMGDAVIGRILHVLNQCDVPVARLVSDAIVKQSEHWVLRVLPFPDAAARDAAGTTTALADEIAAIVGISVGRDRTANQDQRTIEAWASHLMAAVQILHDIWMDYYGPGFGDAAPLFLVRRGQFGHHAVTAMQRGVDLRARVQRFYEDEDPGVLEEAKRAIADSGALRCAIEEGRRRAGAAGQMLDGLPVGWNTGPLRVLAKNVNSALEYVVASVSYSGARLNRQ